ncbi:ACP S-malonyltransferase [Lactiplantibacillus modestisalitolerans]|uniref:Malonyl CoA-acyl carrier protein transacylase n=1 Tax=Lactiplantibacillus modestisalitolerans TaxID=1457219 RepID=A0ABV5WWY7_9LACO|nr:ACP S-malonyltransferase [Lactiplantibacillus modestisalitolerans]
MTTAIIFSGQGQATAGMGAQLYAHEPVYRAVIDRIDTQLKWSLQVDDEWVADATRVPVAITAMNLALFKLVTMKGGTPQVMSGLSLGAYSALMAAGAISLTDGIKIVAERARYMQRAGLQRPGSMAAVLGATPELIQQACQAASSRGTVCPANYNSPTETVIGGDAAAVEAASTFLKAQGVKHVVPLTLTVASHTPLMQPAAEALAKRLNFLNVREPQIPVISDTTVQPFDAQSLKATLVEQLTHPTHFGDCLQTLAARNVTTVIQLGPGTALAKLARRALTDVRVMRIASFEDWQRVQSQLGGALNDE